MEIPVPNNVLKNLGFKEIDVLLIIILVIYEYQLYFTLLRIFVNWVRRVNV